MRIANDLLIDNVPVALSHNSDLYPLDSQVLYDITAEVTAANATNKTFDSGVKASKVVQDITYAAVTPGVAGNSITMTYTGGGTAGSEVVTVVGTAISIQIQTGVSTAIQVKARFDLSAPAIALATATITGTGSNAQVTATVVSFTGGTATEVNITTNAVTIPAHGYLTGTKLQLTSTGTLPAGLATATDYYVILVDVDTIKFATSQANALAGTAVDITGYGSSGAVNTVTVTATLAGSIKLQKNNEPEPLNPDYAGFTPVWFDITSGSQPFSGATTLNWTAVDVGYRSLRAVVTTTSGTVNVRMRINSKGF